MKVAALSINGIEVVVAKTVPPTRDGGSPFYCITHGAKGRHRWEIRIPLSNKDFPVIEGQSAVELFQDDFGLVVNEHKKDFYKNPGLILKRSNSDSRYLLLWNLTPGINGVGHYKVEGNAKVVSHGINTVDEGSKIGTTECPVVLVEGPCKLMWYREGNVQGQQRAWCATYDETNQWTIAPIQDDWSHVFNQLSATEANVDEDVDELDC